MSWTEFYLGDLVEQVNVRAKNADNLKQSVFLGVSNEKGIIAAKYSAEDKVGDYKLVSKGCFAYNPYRINVGSIALVQDDIQGLVSPAYVVFRASNQSILPELLLRFLKSEEGLKQISMYAKGAVRKALRYQDLCKIRIAIPDFERQKIIYSQYMRKEAVSDMISSCIRQQLDLTSQLRQAILKEAMQGKLMPQDQSDEPASELLNRIKAEKAQLIKEKKLKPGKELPPLNSDEIPFSIPDNWAWCRLGSICDLITKGSSPKWQGVRYVEKGVDSILFLTSKNVDNYKLDLSDVSYVEKRFNDIEPRSKLNKGDMLTNIVGGSIGRTAIYELCEDANINQAVCLLRIEHQNIDKQYLLFVMNSNMIIKLMFNMQFAPGRANLSMGNISSFPIPLPPLSEQKRIVEKLNGLMQLCDDLKTSIEHSKGLNERLLKATLREALSPNSSPQLV